MSLPAISSTFTNEKSNKWPKNLLEPMKKSVESNKNEKNNKNNWQNSKEQEERNQKQEDNPPKKLKKKKRKKSEQDQHLDPFPNMDAKIVNFWQKEYNP